MSVMLKDEFTTAYMRAECAMRFRLLGSVTENLTIEVRDLLIEPDDSLPESLRVINELIHHVNGQLTAESSLREKRYPDDVFIDILFETMSDSSSVLQERICRAVTRAMGVR